MKIPDIKIKEKEMNYKKLFPYCSNLDDSEYNSLWECYEEVSLFKRFKHYLANQISCLVLTISTKKKGLERNLARWKK